MTHQVVDKVWGSETVIANRAFCGKVMRLKAGFRCSLHYHRAKDETFLVTKGVVYVEIGEAGRAGQRGDRMTSRTLLDGDSIDVPPRTAHRFTGMTDAEFVEFSTHDDPGDSDRLEPSGPVPTGVGSPA